MTFKAAHCRSYYEKLQCFKFKKQVPASFLIRILEVNFGLYGTAFVPVQTDGILCRDGSRVAFDVSYGPNTITLK